jgi:large-conductance mechanosensitive channel
LNYGVFFNTMINFLIAAFAIFLLIKQGDRYTAEKEEAQADPHAASAGVAHMAEQVLLQFDLSRR